MIDIAALVSVIKKTATTIASKMKEKEKQVVIESNKAWGSGFNGAVDNAAGAFYNDYYPTAYHRQWSLYADPLAEVSYGSGGLTVKARLVEENMRGASTSKGKYGQFHRVVEAGRHGFARTPPLSPAPIDRIEQDMERLSEYIADWEESQMNDILNEGINLFLSNMEQLSSTICPS